MTPQLYKTLLQQQILNSGDIVAFLSLKKKYSDLTPQLYKTLSQQKLDFDDKAYFLHFKFKKKYSDLTPQLYKTLSQQKLDFDDKATFLEFKFEKNYSDLSLKQYKQLKGLGEEEIRKFLKEKKNYFTSNMTPQQYKKKYLRRLLRDMNRI